MPVGVNLWFYRAIMNCMVDIFNERKTRPVTYLQLRPIDAVHFIVCRFGSTDTVAAIIWKAD